MRLWVRCANFLAHGRIGGFRWWHAIGMVVASVLMALAISLRYGEPSHFWFVGPLVLLGAIGLLWLGNRNPHKPREGEPEDER